MWAQYDELKPLNHASSRYHRETVYQVAGGMRKIQDQGTPSSAIDWEVSATQIHKNCLYMIQK